MIIPVKSNMKGVALILCGLLTIAHGRTIGTNNDIAHRVINGEEAKLGERPFQVSVQVNGTHICGGSIVNEYWVITAAHCLNWWEISDIGVVAGTINLEEPYSRHKTEKKILHEFWSAGRDIALIKVSTPFKFSSRVQPVTLPELHSKVQTNSTAILSGWGALIDGSLPDKLQKVSIYIADQDYCRTVMEEQYMQVFPTDICAHDPSIRKGQCNGDSGGPLTVDGILTGIVSRSVKDPGCASTKYPGIYTRVAEFVDWIYENID